MNTYNIALDYLERGFSVIPVGKDKKPAIDWKKFQSERANQKQIETWFYKSSSYNIGIVTGNISGIVVVDVEAGGSVENLPPTVTVKTGGGGWHFYYKHPGRTIKNAVRIRERMDVRGDGGYVVAPPSLHGSGNRYEWAISPDQADFAELPLWIIEKLENQAGNKTDWNKLLNEEVLEGLRNSTATQIAGKLLYHLPADLWEISGWATLKEWNNQRNNPPLSEKELRSIWESIKKIEEKKLFNKQSEIASDVPVSSKFRFTPLNELLEEKEEKTNWIIDGLLPSGGFSVIVAKPKVGKSTLTRQAALAVAQGEPFLGRDTSKGAVLYVSLEEKRSEVRNHFRLMGASGEENLEVYVGSVPEHANEWLKDAIEHKNPVLVIIDTLFRFARVADVNDYSKVNAAMEPLLELARNHSAHLMVVHHARKGGGDGADTALGSTAIFGSVDTAIVLKRSEGRRTIETQQRYGVDMEASVLIFNPEIKTLELGGTKEEADTNKVSEAIMEFLKIKGDPATEKEIDGEVECRTGIKRKALRELVASNKIGRSGSGRKNDPYLYSCFLVPNICREQGNKE